MMVSGQDTALQIGLGSSTGLTTWAANKKGQHRLPYMSESFKGTPNYKPSEALVGAKTTSGMSVMSQKASGGFRSYLTPDVAKLLFFCALGKELTVATSGSQKKHTYVPIPSGLCRSMPHLVAEVDRILEKALYLGFKMNTASISAAAEDYVNFECDGPAYLENIQSPILEGYVVGTGKWTQASGTLTIPTGFLTGAHAYGTLDLIGRVIRLTSGCNEYLFAIKTGGSATTIILDSWPTAGGTLPGSGDASFFDGWKWQILDWMMTPKSGLSGADSVLNRGDTPLPLIPLSSQEYFKFLHGRVYVEGGIANYKITPSTGGGYGKTGDKVSGLPISFAYTGANSLIIEAFDYLGDRAVFAWSGSSAVSDASGELTFGAASGSGTIINIYSSVAAGTLNTGWAIYTETYSEVTDVKLNISNNIKDGKFGANGSPYQLEMQPQGREFTVDLTMDFTNRYSALRRRKMMEGNTVYVQLVFQTTVEDVDGAYNTSVDSTGNPYKIVITMPSCYLMDGIPNIGGPDTPTVSSKFQAREIPGVQEAITVEIYDDQGTTGQYDFATGRSLAPEARVDGLS